MYDTPELAYSAGAANYRRSRRMLDLALARAVNEWRVAAELVRASAKEKGEGQEWAAKNLEYAAESLAGLVLLANGHQWKGEGVPQTGFAATSRQLGDEDIVVVPAKGSTRRAVFVIKIDGQRRR